MNKQIFTKQRTIDNMKPEARSKAKRLWERMNDPLDEGALDARDTYHAMFRDDSNFLAGTEPYQKPE